MSNTYRVLIKGTLRQTTAMTIGGTNQAMSIADDTVARDGSGRPTISGSALAGSLVETAARIFPDLFEEKIKEGLSDQLRQIAAIINRVTGKRRSSTAKRDETDYAQSLWKLRHAHPAAHDFELRQGVGIRQKTGATAVEARALYDVETLPAGTAWPFELEIVSELGGPAVEALALFAVAEWINGRCWMGANAARGQGWMELEGVELLVLPQTIDAVMNWPDNRFDSLENAWDELEKIAGATTLAGLAGIRERLDSIGFSEDCLPDNRFCYQTITVRIGEDNPDQVKNNPFGIDSVSVGGHAQELARDCSAALAVPDGCEPEGYRRIYVPDHPVATTRRTGDAKSTPFIPGSGLRGPLRHKLAAVHNTRRKADNEEPVRDPNDKAFQDEIKTRNLNVDDLNDAVTSMFGIATRSGRILVSDARLTNPDTTQMFWLQRHAEDEFTAGVFGNSKFDRTAIVNGCFEFRIVIESSSEDELAGHSKTIEEALQLAALGFVPIGGSKWAGHGWAAWNILSSETGKAGSLTSTESSGDRSHVHKPHTPAKPATESASGGATGATG